MYASVPLDLHTTHYHFCHTILVYFCLQKIVSIQFPTFMLTIFYSKLTHHYSVSKWGKALPIGTAQKHLK
jgi:hypothetical protein